MAKPTAVLLEKAMEVMRCFAPRPSIKVVATGLRKDRQPRPEPGLAVAQASIVQTPGEVGEVEDMAVIGLSIGHEPACADLHHFARVLARFLIVPTALRIWRNFIDENAVSRVP